MQDLEVGGGISAIMIACTCTCFFLSSFSSLISKHVYTCSFFLGKVTALGVLCCFALFVCLTLLASFFLPSHLSFKNMYIQCTLTCVM